MYAIVKTGGKQYKASVDDVLTVEKLPAAVGESVSLDVIFLADNGEITTDEAKLAKASVNAEVVEHFRGEKQLVFKFKKRKGYKRTKGHRQELTTIRITDIASSGGKKATAAPKAASAPKADKAEAAPAEKKPAAKKAAPKAAESKTAEKKPAAKKTAAKKDDADKKPAEKKPAEKKPAAKKAAPKKAAAKKTETKASDKADDAASKDADK